MSNSSSKEERIKIKKNKSNPNEFREDELYSIGVPEPFFVECSAFVDEHDVAERIIHKKLESFRPNWQRDFLLVLSYLSC